MKTYRHLLFCLFIILTLNACGVKGPPKAPSGTAIKAWGEKFTAQPELWVKIDLLETNIKSSREKSSKVLSEGLVLSGIRQEIVQIQRELSAPMPKKATDEAMTTPRMQKQERLSNLQERLVKACKKALTSKKESELGERSLIRSYLSYKKAFNEHRDEMDHYYQDRKNDDQEKLKTLQRKELDRQRRRIEKSYEDALMGYEDEKYKEAIEEIEKCKDRIDVSELEALGEAVEAASESAEENDDRSKMLEDVNEEDIDKEKKEHPVKAKIRSSTDSKSKANKKE
ncbi:MAG: hypothetical protein HQK50_03860 [Oligoflexia bacterium]|nr:hypothetical protein [Oligoflexia bacterium]MBF0364679.1 hypothetical protein [Oligoflexia bacterium]